MSIYVEADNQRPTRSEILENRRKWIAFLKEPTCNSRPKDFSMRDCIEAGECGCIDFSAAIRALHSDGER
ncbi:hypothetical protein AX761_20220 [Rhizobium sp. 58]|nr:hypothetical protein AX761_20220 [Rhizobium sp. 58]